MAAAFSNDAAKLWMQLCSLEDSLAELGNQGGFLKRSCDPVVAADSATESSAGSGSTQVLAAAVEEAVS